MTLCGRPSPVFIDGGGASTLLLDDIFGWRFADDIRSLYGARLHAALLDPDNPYAYVTSCGSDSFLAASVSSPASAGAILLSAVAGLTFYRRKNPALWIMAAGAAVSLLDFIVRCRNELSRNSSEREMLMWDNLPGQVVANLVFQFVLPFTAALALVVVFAKLRRLVFASVARTRKPS
jgi:hypothetical protein